MKKENLRRADLMFSIVLILLSIFVFVKSIGYFFNPFSRDFALVSGDSIKDAMINWNESPALLPLILSALLLLCGVSLLHIAKRQGAKIDFLTKEKVKALFKNRELYVVLIVVGTLCLYIFLLIPLFRKHLNFFPRFQAFPFMLATFVYLFSTMVIFNKKSFKKILFSLITAAIAAGVIAYGFGIAAMIPLP
ncbi:MAG: tripartite tricarboxylate transporter TctB family protein [Eubacteriales bacterium]|jgi:magnesium-transporting ATPase (P-type)|nr:tripartite tricarboxylate transporter TctB family protein [Eubacteriales bacterium]